MATKKTSKKSTKTNQKKTKNAPRKQTARDRELEAQVREDELREKEQKLRIFSVFVFAFSVILFFVAIIDGAGIWNIVHNFYIGLFGRFAAIALPILCLVFSFLLTVVKGKNNIIPETVSVLILILLGRLFISFRRQIKRAMISPMRSSRLIKMRLNPLTAVFSAQLSDGFC